MHAELKGRWRYWSSILVHHGPHMANRRVLRRAFQLLRDELEMNMRLIGAATVEDLNPSMLDTRGLVGGHYSAPSDTLGLNVYDPLVSPRFAEKSKL